MLKTNFKNNKAIGQNLYFVDRMSTLKKITREPLVHFLGIGLLIFLINGIFNSDQNLNTNQTILIDDNDIHRLITQYQQVWNEAPDQSTIKKLIEQYIESEITYREALAMNLDHNDEIIKRRLKQKYEFLVKDLITSSQASDDDLKAYYEDHKADFQTDKLYSFNQYYFSPDRRSSPLEDAKQFLANQIDKNPDHSSTLTGVDPIHLQKSFSNVTEHYIRQEFGMDFLTQLRLQSANSWVGPLSSGFGIHVVYMESIDSSQTQKFEEVRDDVNLAYEDELTKTYNKNLLDKVKENYAIEYDLDKWKNIVE